MILTQKNNVLGLNWWKKNQYSLALLVVIYSRKVADDFLENFHYLQKIFKGDTEDAAEKIYSYDGQCLKLYFGKSYIFLN